MSTKLTMMLEVAAALHAKGDDVWQQLEATNEAAEKLLEDIYGTTESPARRLVAGVLATHRGNAEAARRDLRVLPGGNQARVVVKPKRMVVEPPPSAARPRRFLHPVLATATAVAALCAVGLAYYGLLTLPTVSRLAAAGDKEVAAKAIDAVLAGVSGKAAKVSPRDGEVPSAPTDLLNALIAPLPGCTAPQRRVVARVKTPTMEGVNTFRVPSVAAYYTRLRDWLVSQGVAVTAVPACPVPEGEEAFAATYVPARRVVEICPGYTDPSKVQNLRLLAHEAAHHLQTRLPQLPGKLDQAEAEAFGNIVIMSLGFTPEPWSFDYIKGRDGSPAALEKLRPRFNEMAAAVLPTLLQGPK